MFGPKKLGKNPKERRLIVIVTDYKLWMIKRSFITLEMPINWRQQQTHLNICQVQNFHNFFCLDQKRVIFGIISLANILKKTRKNEP